jgi:hypothetical protein
VYQESTRWRLLEILSIGERYLLANNAFVLTGCISLTLPAFSHPSCI